MTHNYKTACVFGGTGFIGRQVVRELASLGVTVKVATRVPERAYFLKPSGVVGQIVPLACDPKDPKSIAAAVEGCDYVVNCVGILYERKLGDFMRMHKDFANEVAKACKKAGVGRFVHISALGVEKSKAKYAVSKLEGEKAVQRNFKTATILRPSVVFGEDDSFFNLFAGLAEIFPALPLIGGGKTKFQPVFVGDVADAVMAALTRPAVGDQDPQGRIYELGGPEILSFRQIYEKLFTYTGWKRGLIYLPFWIAKIDAWFLSMLPNPMLTPDQVESLKTDNVVGENALTLADLDVNPTGLDLILPTYMRLYRPGGRFGKAQSA